MVKMYTRYDPPPSVVMTFEDCDVLTEQSHMESCDINNIVLNYMRTGNLPIDEAKPVYGDFFNANGDYEDFVKMREVYYNAVDDFHDLPSNLREKYDNDPDKYFSSDDFIQSLSPNTEVPDPTPDDGSGEDGTKEE